MSSDPNNPDLQKSVSASASGETALQRFGRWARHSGPAIQKAIAGYPAKVLKDYQQGELEAQRRKRLAKPMTAPQYRNPNGMTNGDGTEAPALANPYAVTGYHSPLAEVQSMTPAAGGQAPGAAPTLQRPVAIGAVGGKTVYKGKGAAGETSYTDHLSGQPAAKPPPGPDNTPVISANGSGKGGSVSVIPSAAFIATNPYTANYGGQNNALTAARDAAIARGDFTAAERSFMTPDERAAADAKQQSSQLFEQAYGPGRGMNQSLDSMIAERNARRAAKAKLGMNLASNSAAVTQYNKDADRALKAAKLNQNAYGIKEFTTGTDPNGFPIKRPFRFNKKTGAWEALTMPEDPMVTEAKQKVAQGANLADVNKILIDNGKQPLPAP